MNLRPGWCHGVVGTYGSWLPGDPRGFRTRGHREHVEGDYRSPSTKDYRVRHEQAKQRMKGSAVALNSTGRRVACKAIRHALVEVHGLKVLAISVSAMHVHLLARFPAAQKPTDSIRGLRATDPVRHLIGIAKKESAKRLVEHELVPRGNGKVWARRGKIVRVRDRAHQVNVFDYILRHAEEGAGVWTFRDMEG